MPQETIANMPGVRRGTVNEAAGKLQNSRLIRHGRGRIGVVDRAKTGGYACECYAAVRREFDRQLTFWTRR